MPRNDLIQLRQGIENQWSFANPVLESGEPGYATDTKILKIGDGINGWNSLPSVSQLNVVYTTGNQIINGNKNFNDYITFNNELGNIVIQNDNGALRIDVGTENYAFGPTSATLDVDIISKIGSFEGLNVNSTGVSLNGHKHTVADITNFGSGVSGLIPSVSISGSGNIQVINNNGNYTIGVTGLQLTGSYVSLTSSENISGTKTFLNNVIVTGQFSSVSGYFKDFLSLNGTGVSTTGHTHQIYQINNLQSELNNKQPTGNYVSLTGVESISGTKTFLNNIVATGQFSSVSGYFKDYLSLNGTGVSITGHTHQIYQISNLQSALDNKQPTGSYVSLTGIESVSGTKTFLNNVVVTGQFSSVSGYFKNYLSLNGSGVSITGHSHTVSDITNFNSGVSGIVPVVTGTGSIQVVFNNNTYTINVTGLQLTGHQHPYTDINNFCTGVAECVNTPLLAGTGIVLSFVNGTGLYIHFTGGGGSLTISNTGISAISGYFRDYLSLNGSGISLTGHTHTVSDISNFGSGVSGLLTPYQLALTNPVTGTGTANYITKFGTGGSGLNNSLVYDNGTGVAIGTTTPNASLTVYSTIYGAPSSSNKGAFNIAFGNTNGLSLGTYSTSPYSNYIQSMGTAGTIYSLALNPIGGNVGINTVDPSGKFHIESVVSNNSYILLSNPGNVIKTHIGVGNSDSVPFLASINNIQLASGTYGWGFFDRNAEGNLHIQRKNNSSSWSSVMMMDRNNGNVGIGTGVQATTPPEKLTVDGNIRLADTSATQKNIIQFYRGGGNQYDYSIGMYGSLALAISLASDSTSQRPLQVGYHSGVTFLPKFHVNGYTGAVGINTTTPSGYLDVAGDVFIRGTGGTAGRINFKSGTFADTMLNIRSDTNGNIYMDGGGPSVRCGSQDGVVALNGYSTNIHIGHLYNAATTAQHIRFSPGSNELMRMTNSGTIGIGLPLTSSLFNIQPFNNCRLHIMGSGANSSSSALNVANSGNSSLLFVRNDGNVGIGTSNPSHALHVAGSGRMDLALINTTSVFVPAGGTPGSNYARLNVNGAIYCCDNNTNGVAIYSSGGLSFWDPIGSEWKQGETTVLTFSGGESLTFVGGILTGFAGFLS